MTCHVAKGDLPLKINWLINEKPIFSHMGIVTTKFGDRSGFLSISSVTGGNSGNYTCIATNEAGQFNYSATLFVHGN